MKQFYKIFITSFTLYLLMQSFSVFGQGANCASADPFCTATGAVFPNNTGLPDASTTDPGNNYGCLNTQPNPAWYYMEIGASGNLVFNIGQTNSSGGGLDVDFILYGPYPDLATAQGTCGNLGNGNSSSNTVQDCSYSTAATETATLNNAVSGQVYLALITNFSNQAGNITFNQTGGTGSTNCSIVCPPVDWGVFNSTANTVDQSFNFNCDDVQVFIEADQDAFSVGQTITPCIKIEVSPTNGTLGNTVEFLENGTSIGTLSPSINTNWTGYLNYATPGAVHSFILNETTAGTNMAYKVIDCNSGVVLTSGVWVSNGSPQTVTVNPPPNLAGITTWSITPPTGTPGLTSGTNGVAVFDPSAVPTGTYSITYSWDDQQGNCAGTMAHDVVVTNPYVVTNLSYTTPICKSGGGMIAPTLTGTAGGAYTAAPSGLSIDVNTGAINAAASTIGTYTVTYFVGTALPSTCNDSITTSVVISDILASTTVTNVSCKGVSDGVVNTTASGGTTPYNYSWNTTAISQNLTGIPAGIYTVTTSDASGCITVVVSTVTEPTAISLTNNFTTANCGASDGTATIVATGGTINYTYLWSTNAANQTTATATGLTSGIFVVTVTDANSCVAIDNILVQNTTPASTITSTSVTCNGGSNGSIAVLVSGGSTPFTYVWGGSASSQTTGTVTGLSTGNYLGTVTDNSGCQLFISEMINEPTALTVIANLAQTACGGASNGDILLVSTGGITPYTYLWGINAGNQTTATITGLSTNTYSYTVTDANLCTSNAVITITQPTNLSVTVNTSGISCFGTSNGNMTVVAAGGTTGYTYLWSNNAITQNISGLAQGNYTVTVTDASTCMTVTSATITESLNIAIVTTVTPVACKGLNNGGINTSITGGTTPYNYLWSNLATTQSINPAAPNSYTMTVTDVNGCTGTTAGTITEPSSVTVTTTITDVSCNSASNGGVLVTVNGGTTPYSYSWSSSATTQNITNQPAGGYVLFVTDASACLEKANVTISEPIVLSVTANCTGVTTVNGSDGTSNTTTTGGTTPYTYVWSNSSSTSSINGLTPGVYSVTATDVNLCNSVSTCTVTAPLCGVTMTTTPSSVSCNGGSDGQVIAILIGSSPPVSYQWSNSQTVGVASGLTTGIYAVTATDIVGCIDSATVTITQPVAVSVSSSSTLAGCNLANGSATVVVSGGITPYTYLWNANAANQTTSTANALASGNYNVTITDANLCASVNNVLVQNPTPTLTIVTTSVTCNGGSNGSVVVTATGGVTPYIYVWNTGETTSSITGLPKGNYFATVTDQLSCQSNVGEVILQPSKIVITPNITLMSCNGVSDGSISLNITGGFSPYIYLWGANAGTQTISTVTGLAANTYTATITDVNTCTNFGSFTITEPTSLSVTLSSINITCFGSSDGIANSIVAGGTTPYSYTWNNGKTTASISGLAPGGYQLCLQDANGCSVGCNTIPVTACVEVKRILVDACNTNGPAEGEEEMFFMRVGPNAVNTATLTITWPNGSNNWLGVCSDPIWITNTNATITNGGVLIAPIGGVIPANAQVLVVTSTTPIVSSMDFSALADTVYVIFQCAGNTSGHFANYNSSGGARTLVVDFGGSCVESVTYDRGLLVKQNGASGAQNGAGVTFDFPGNATYFNKGCVAPFDTAVLNTVIIQPAELLVNADSINISCTGNGDGVVIANVIGGTTPYAYIWNDITNSTTQSVSGLGAGTYTVTVTDANSCATIDSTIVIDPPTMNFNVGVLDVHCNGESSGAALSFGSGGTTPYSFLWSNGVANDTLLNVPAATYQVTVTDANNCQVVNIALVREAPPIGIVSTVTEATCGLSNATANVTVTGGVLPYNYAWSNGGSTSLNTGLAMGVFTLTVTDDSLCTNISQITITEVGMLLTSVTSANINCNTGSDGSVVSFVTGGSTPYSYLWNNNATTTSISGLVAGNYDVTITDNVSCSKIESVTLTEPTAIVAAFTIVDEKCNLSNGVISVISTGGGTSYSYLWSNGATTTTLSGLSGGNYSITTTDNSNCISVDAVSISNNLVVFNFNGNIQNAICVDQNGQISVAIIGGTSPYTYVWSPNTDSTQSVSSLGAGNYAVTVTDASGCIGDTSFVVAAETNITADFNTAFENNDVVPANLLFTNSSTNANYYTWIFGDGDTLNNVANPNHLYNDAGTYTVQLLAAIDSSHICFDTISHLVILIGNSTLEIPNVFSPNGDGINDVFTVSADFLATIDAKIFNRWGEMVFAWNRIGGAWDGRNFAGLQASEGTYFILLNATGLDGTVFPELRSSITLVR